MCSVLPRADRTVRPSGQNAVKMAVHSLVTSIRPGSTMQMIMTLVFLRRLRRHSTATSTSEALTTVTSITMGHNKGPNVWVTGDTGAMPKDTSTLHAMANVPTLAGTHTIATWPETKTDT